MDKHTRRLNDILGEPIHLYSRNQAISDGVLIDVSKAAHEVGFRISVALTAAVWAECIAWCEADSMRQTRQNEEGRLWDVLWKAAEIARHANGNRVPFQVYHVPRGGRSTLPSLSTLHLHIGPGDAGEPVITILLPMED